jgi:multiple sugar transport system ATP-binding protein
MATIELRQVEKKFGRLHAVKPLDLTIGSGEFVVLLGPSGCGKTTTLRMISGLEAVTGGHIHLDGRDVTWLHPSERDIAFVFQFFALYPHMSVQDNVRFPLQAQGMPASDIEIRVGEMVKMLRIEHLLKLRPGSLSGGDRQRVALARALVRRPAAFLMDEPLGALDADLRETMRAEIKRLHIANQATSIYVTHDQIEAMALGDRIVVMSAAEVQQVGTPSEVYHEPANLFVARFIGSPGMNLIKGRYADGVVDLPGDLRYSVPESWRGALSEGFKNGEVIVGFRPEAGCLSENGALEAGVYATDMQGAFTMLHLAIGDEATIVDVRAERWVEYPLEARVRFDIDPEGVRFFDPKTERAVRRGGAQ